MSNELAPSDPARFGLTTFSSLLPVREHIVGEDPGSFQGFHDGIMQSLAPVTPYESVIAENLVAIEWELIQHRRMRDAGLRKIIGDAICDAVVKKEKAAHDDALDEAWDSHVESGGTEDDWEAPFSFDRDDAAVKGRDLATRAISREDVEFAAACDEIDAMGIEVVELMGEAYRSSSVTVRKHEEKLQELERRRREVKRDFDALQKARPVEAEVIEL
ncbi:hypothetical protein [Tropicimonas sediminicola]|uniref:Uncharacterized protein n=1 Tax=Tropicimonas sediminicola TaxID=1031541 RepID=A0A239M238_9RHOB|nr:hypothetical protein [Tropicimonas sediminicola]SNT36715.1 hypothetical protein SAMN05421757_11235 [Tropicimonas sediminicola]